ncbi:hypothetical protein D3C85_1460050 [compost metagenome]
MIIDVTLNIASDTPRRSEITGSLRSLLNLETPRPNITAKNSTESRLPWAMALITLSGMIPTIICPRL